MIAARHLGDPSRPDGKKRETKIPAIGPPFYFSLLNLICLGFPMRLSPEKDTHQTDNDVTVLSSLVYTNSAT